MINIPTTSFAVVIVMLLAVAFRLAYKATHNAKSKFSFEECFLDLNGKTSLARIGTFFALAVSTWAFAFMTLDGKLTEWYMTSYMGAWVINGLGNKFLDKGKPSVQP